MLIKFQSLAIPTQRSAAFLCLFTPASLLAAGNISETICTHSESTVSRSIQLVYQSESSPIPCQVLYGENGVLDEIASAKNTKGFCEKKERKIAKNLVNMGWKCSHSLFGATANKRTDLTLNLFPPALQALRPNTQANDKIDAEVVRQQAELSATFESKHRERLQNEIAEIFASQTADGYSVEVYIDAVISVTKTQASGDSENLATTSQDSDTNSGFSVATPQLYNHALVSKPLESEQQAHQFAAELHRIYPNVHTRISQNTTAADQWSVVLGVANAAAELQSAIALFDENVKNHFSLVNYSDSADEAVQPMEFVSNDWPRYLIAACYSDGQSTLQSMAECSGFELGVDSFLDCVSGSVCSPQQFSGVLSQENIDLIDAIGSGDPVAAARGILANSVRGCESMTYATESELTECVAMSILDDEQQFIMQCYTQTTSLPEMLDCAGVEEISGVMSLYQQCGQDGLSGARCLADLIDNDAIKLSASCLDAGSKLDIANCITQVNTGIDATALVQCLDTSIGPVSQLSCAAEGHLDEEQQLLLSCASGNPSATAFASCSIRETGLLTNEQWKTAECMMQGNVSAARVLDCAGGRFASVEIAQCVAEGIELSQCFDTDTFISDVIDDTVDDILNIEAFAQAQNDIALFRENLYALEGGDLGAVFANPSATNWLNSSTEEATKEAVSTVKGNLQKATKGLLNKIGFGN